MMNTKINMIIEYYKQIKDIPFLDGQILNQGFVGDRNIAYSQDGINGIIVKGKNNFLNEFFEVKKFRIVKGLTFYSKFMNVPNQNHYIQNINHRDEILIINNCSVSFDEFKSKILNFNLTFLNNTLMVTNGDLTPILEHQNLYLYNKDTGGKSVMGSEILLKTVTPNFLKNNVFFISNKNRELYINQNVKIFSKGELLELINTKEIHEVKDMLIQQDYFEKDLD